MPDSSDGYTKLLIPFTHVRDDVRIQIYADYSQDNCSTRPSPTKEQKELIRILQNSNRSVRIG